MTDTVDTVTLTIDGVEVTAPKGALVIRIAEQIAPTSANVRALTGRDSVDPLSAFPLGEIVAEAVGTAARTTGRSLRLEPVGVAS